jgi:hypothetical protein
MEITEILRCAAIRKGFCFGADQKLAELRSAGQTRASVPTGTELLSAAREAINQQKKIDL